MLSEINALVHFLSQHNGGHPLPASLSAWLESRFQGHWHTADPEQGSAYRSLDKQCLPSSVTQHLELGDDYTIWVDPGCVCARFEARSRLTCIYGKLPNPPKDVKLPSEAEEDHLAGFYSPVKSNKAIAIVSPSARLPPSVAVAPPTPANVPSGPASATLGPSAEIFSPTPVRPSRSSSPVSRSASAGSSSDASSLFSQSRRKLSSASSSSSSPGPSRPNSAQSFVKEHLNGKVGVLGGGIMLGQNAEDDEHSVNVDAAAAEAHQFQQASLSASPSSSSATSSDTENAQMQQKPRRRREHRGKRGSGKQAARERALAQKAPRWCALDHHQQPQPHQVPQFNHHQAWYMQPNINMPQYAY